jgi:hypothetical protein
MTKIADIIASSNADVIKNHNQKKIQTQGKGEFLGYNQAGYAVYNINGQKLIPLGFYVSEEKFAEYYKTAREITEKGLRTPTGSAEKILEKPDVNSLLHYSLDFFCNNFNLTKSMKIKDVLSLAKMMTKELPSMMRG